MLFKIGLVKQLEGNQTIKLFLNVKSENVEDAISEALKLAKQYNAKVDFIDELVQEYVDISEDKLLEVIEKCKPKVRGDEIYG